MRRFFQASNIASKNGFSKKPAFLAIFTCFSGFVVGLTFMGCSAPATQMKCTEIQFRMDHQTLSDGEKQAMEQELKDCDQRVERAKRQDSAAIKKIESHFSSDEDSL